MLKIIRHIKHYIQYQIISYNINRFKQKRKCISMYKFIINVKKINFKEQIIKDKQILNNKN